MTSLRFLSSVPKEVLKTFCQSIDQAMGEDHAHARLKSVATKIIPTITADEVGVITSSDQPFTSLIDLANNKGNALKAADVQQALVEEGLNSNPLMPYLYENKTSQMV